MTITGPLLLAQDYKLSNAPKISYAATLDSLHHGYVRKSLIWLAKLGFPSLPRHKASARKRHVIFLALLSVQQWGLEDELSHLDLGFDFSEKGSPSSLLSTQSDLADKVPRILLVEDDWDLHRCLKLILSDRYQVISAQNGKEAIHALRHLDSNGQKWLPDLILSNLMMPIMDGYQLLIRLRNQTEWAQIPVVMLTAKAGVEAKIKALRIGVDD
ncbi:MAG: response regulator [Bacteroidota bacterium]